MAAFSHSNIFIKSALPKSDNHNYGNLNNLRRDAIETEFVSGTCQLYGLMLIKSEDVKMIRFYCSYCERASVLFDFFVDLLF